MLPALRSRRRDLPPELCAALDRALAPDPEARGTLDELAEALADALPEVSDDGGTIAPHPLEHVDRPLPPLGRVAAGAAAAGLTALALAAAGDPPSWAATGGAGAPGRPRICSSRRSRARRPRSCSSRCSRASAG